MLSLKRGSSVIQCSISWLLKWHLLNWFIFFFFFFFFFFDFAPTIDYECPQTMYVV